MTVNSIEIEAVTKSRETGEPVRRRIGLCVEAVLVSGALTLYIQPEDGEGDIFRRLEGGRAEVHIEDDPLGQPSGSPRFRLRIRP